MIDKIYIPTLHRVDDQLTYNNLPEQLKEKVVFVVQEWEREQYKYPNEYLVLPSKINKTDRYCLAKTRKHIYETAGKTKYVMIDDDTQFLRRNVKYFGEPSNMESSRRPLTDEETIEMFDLFSEYLEKYTVCGCYPHSLPPPSARESINRPTYIAMFLNGSHFHDDLKSFDLTSCRTGEDVNFFLHLLTHGYQIRRDNEYLVSNDSMGKTDSYIWDTQSSEDSIKDLEQLRLMFPSFVSFDLDNLGYKGQPKMKVKWKDAYNNSATLPV